MRYNMQQVSESFVRQVCLNLSSAEKKGNTEKP